MPGPDTKPIVFKYTFLTDVDQKEDLRTFSLKLDPKTLGLLKEQPETTPEWTKLRKTHNDVGGIELTAWRLYGHKRLPDNGQTATDGAISPADGLLG